MKVSDLIESPPPATVMDGLEAIASTDPVVWCALNRRIKGEALVYDNARKLSEDSLGEIRRTLIKSDYESELYARLLHHRPFLKQPLRDNHRHKVYEKARQMGVTELSASETFHFLATHPGTKWITCVPDDAEILTRRGWKLWHEVEEEEEVLTLDTASHTSRWERCLEIQTHKFKGRLWDAGNHFHCTANHRWPVNVRQSGWVERDVKVTDELKQHHNLIRMAPHETSGRSILSPRMAAILGWVVTDGHHRQGQYQNMEVYQSSRKHLTEIEALLKNKRKEDHRWTSHPTIALGEKGGRIVGYNEHGEALYGDGYHVHVSLDDRDAILATGYKDKSDLSWIVTRLSQPAAEAMFDAMLKADGNWSGRNLTSRFFAKRDPRVRDAFQILCTMLGKAANLTERGLYVIEPTSRSAAIRAVYPGAEGRKYDGVVWCPRTPSGTWFMRYRGRVVFTSNTFPRDKQLIDFSTTRVSAAFAESPRMAALMGVPNQVFTKRIGDSYWIFRSAWESNLGEGVDADGVTLDEKDRMRDKVEFAFKESLKSSRFGWFREVSTPTLPNHGIDVPFRASDQQVWMVKCEKCGDWQEITWKENIVQVKDFPLGCKELPAESYEFLCRKQKCRGKLDRVYSGRWVARFPDREHIRGYHIPQLIAPWLSATRIMQDKIDLRFLDIWLCYVVGVPAGGELEMVTDEACAATCSGHQLFTSRTKDYEAVSVGVDWGQLNWVVVVGRNAINQRPYVLGIGIFEDTSKELESAEMVWNYIRSFVPDITIADAGYGKDRNSYLLRKLCPNGDEGKFYAQWYNPSQKSSRTFLAEWSDPARARVLVDRTLQLKNVCHAVKEREFGLPSLDIPQVQLLVRHLKSLAPFREIDEETKQIVETIKSSGDDHLAHALASALLGLEKVSKTGKFSFSFE